MYLSSRIESVEIKIVGRLDDHRVDLHLINALNLLGVAVSTGRGSDFIVSGLRA